MVRCWLEPVRIYQSKHKTNPSTHRSNGTDVYFGVYTFAALVGYFCDRYRSRKLPLICGFAAIALATILFMLARNPWIFLLARVFQGLSGAVVGVLGLTMIAETASPEQLGAHMAYGSLALTWGMLTGPMAGGFLYVHLRIRTSNKC